MTFKVESITRKKPSSHIHWQANELWALLLGNMNLAADTTVIQRGLNWECTAELCKPEGVCTGRGSIYSPANFKLDHLANRTPMERCGAQDVGRGARQAEGLCQAVVLKDLGRGVLGRQKGHASTCGSGGVLDWTEDSYQVLERLQMCVCS